MCLRISYALPSEGPLDVGRRILAEVGIDSKEVTFNQDSNIYIHEERTSMYPMFPTHCLIHELRASLVSIRHTFGFGEAIVGGGEWRYVKMENIKMWRYLK